MELSKRLQTIADMVTPGNRVADVGCDHGFVSIYLVREKIASKVYAMDLRPGPLARAKEHIESYGYDHYIETRLSDGITALKKGEADALVCAGMGGRLMTKILSDGYEKVMEMKELILQPQSDLQFFRAFLRTNGLVITAENMVKEDGKFYPMMKAVPDRRKRETKFPGEEQIEFSNWGERQQAIKDAYGPFLLTERHPVLQEYLEVLKVRNQEILRNLASQNEKAILRREEIEQELSDIEMCLSIF